LCRDGSAIRINEYARVIVEKSSAYPVARANGHTIFIFVSLSMRTMWLFRARYPGPAQNLMERKTHAPGRVFVILKRRS
jgi:hypothetical protein